MGSQFLSLRTSQNLTLTPTLQQSLKVLQLSALELEAEIAQTLHDNPMLERDDTLSDASPESLFAPVSTDPLTANVASVSQGQTARGAQHARDGELTERPESAQPVTLRDHLLEQLAGIRNITEHETMLVRWFIESLDESGWLTSDLELVKDTLQPLYQQGVLKQPPEQLIQSALAHLQRMEPSGVGARHLGECLDLQLTHVVPERWPEWVATPELALAHTLCLNHLEVLATGNTQRVATLLQTDLSTIKRIHALLLKLNPRPASAWTTPVADYAVPDVLVKKINSRWVPYLNDNVLPKLKINQTFAHVLATRKRADHAPLNDQWQQAKSFIKIVGQRFDTILRVAQVVVAHQHDFFEHGWGALKPLTLREVAQELGMHESTISRATTQKFILTPLGTVELRRFFATSMTKDSGQTTSSTAIQNRISQLIAQESAQSPLTDSQLMALLDQEGIQVARRTIAKYRETLRIPVAALRKSQAGAQER